MSALRESLGFLTSRLRQVGIFVALILIVLLFQILTDGILLEPQNVTNLVVQNSYILILAIGMVMVIIAGHIDLSVGSIAGFIGAVAGVMIVHWGWAWWAGHPRLPAGRRAGGRVAGLLDCLRRASPPSSSPSPACSSSAA